jgi:hypothetical protein
MWNMVYQRVILTGTRLQEDDIETITAHVRQEWSQFVGNVLPDIEDRLKASGF